MICEYLNFAYYAEAQEPMLSLRKILKIFFLSDVQVLSQVSRICLVLYFGWIDPRQANVNDLLKNVEPEGSPRAGSDT